MHLIEGATSLWRCRLSFHANIFFFVETKALLNVQSMFTVLSNKLLNPVDLIAPNSTYKEQAAS